MASNVTEMRMSEHGADGFTLVDVGKKFGTDIDKEIENWLNASLMSLIDSHRDLHLSKIPKMRKIYNGRPQSESRAFPFPNASNIVIQVAGDRVDTLTARILGFLFATSPLWHFFYPAVTDSPKEAERKRQILEEYMDVTAYDPRQVDLKRIYGVWCTDHAKLGTGFVKAYWEDNVEAMAVGYTNSRNARFKEKEMYYGPRLDNVEHEHILMDAQAPTIERSRLVVQKRPLTKYDLEERVFDGFYDRAAVKEILEKPDRYGPDINQAKELRKKGVQNVQSTVNAEWDIYECYFPWLHMGRKFRLVYSYHLASRTTLRRIFNPVPNNQTPILRAKLGYRTTGAYGIGYSELLEKYQEEASTTHNNRIDNSTLANTRFFRIDPSCVNIGSQVDIFPSGAITAPKDGFEAFAMSDVYQSSFDNEQSIMALADQRAGIAPAVTGMGTGGMQGKGKTSFYSAGPALASMAEGNHRTNLATSDFRHAHQNVGSLLTDMNAKFGIAGREKMFGKDAKYLTKALKEYAENACYIPIRSTDASLNKEVEKQTSMLMAGLLQRFYTGQLQMAQAMLNPMIPENDKKLIKMYFESGERLHRDILRDFGYSQPYDYIPETSELVNEKGAQPNAPQAQGADPAALAASAAAKQPVAQLPIQSEGGSGTPAM